MSKFTSPVSCGSCSYEMYKFISRQLVFFCLHYSKQVALDHHITNAPYSNVLFRIEIKCVAPSIPQPLFLKVQWSIKNTYRQIF